MRALLILLVVVPAFAQITVTVSSGANRTARRTFTERGIPGIAVRSVQVCGAPGSRVMASEVIQQAARNNSLLFSPGSIDALTFRKSVAEVLLDAGEFAGLAGTFVSGSVKMKPADKTRWVVGTSGAAITFKYLAGILKPVPTNAPAARLRALELPYELTVPPTGCWTGTALGRD